MNIVIIGASGGIGRALVELYSATQDHVVYALSRIPYPTAEAHVVNLPIDYEDEITIESAAQEVAKGGSIDRLIVATGFLHDEQIRPEKSLNDLSPQQFQKHFLLNTIGPALVAKHFSPMLSHTRQSVFAVLSARVGSITDNRLGGWYGYRASKAALNMTIKTASIELKRKNPLAIVVTLHPGTVDTSLSQPFQRNVKPESLFSPGRAANQLDEVIKNLTPEETGKLIAWDGSPIAY